MAWALHTYIVDPGDDTIKVEHVFYGLDKKEAKSYFQEHIGSCEYFAPAVKEGRVFGEWEKLDDDVLPEPEEFSDSERLNSDGDFG